MFAGPYREAPLDEVTPEMKHAFRSKGEALIHGDSIPGR